MSAEPHQFSPAWEWANAYRKCGLSIVPVKHNEKRPALDWEQFIGGVPDTAHQKLYCDHTGEVRDHPRLGAITGAAFLEPGKKLLVIDLDQKPGKDGIAAWDGWISVEEMGAMPDTWHAVTGSGGQHWFFSYPDTLTIQNGVNTGAPGVDVRADGGFVVLGPTTHPDTGKPYEWVNAPWDYEIEGAPQWLLDKVSARKTEEPAPAQPERFESAPSPQKNGLAGIPTNPDTNTDGKFVDGREKAMSDMVFAALVKLRRHQTNLPDAHEIDRLTNELFAAFAATHAPKDKTKTLEEEGRGRSAVKAKIQSTLKKWNTTLLQEAQRPAVVEDWATQPINIKSVQTDGEPIDAVGFDPFDASELEGDEIEPRVWMVPDLIPGGAVTLLGGSGGTGKSLLALQLATAVASGSKWIGHEVTAPDGLSGALYISAEDDRKELHRRLSDIKGGVTWADLKGLQLVDMAGKEAQLVALDRETGQLGPTHLYKRILEHVTETKPALVVIDTLSDFYAGNENDRVQVKKFVGLLIRICRMGGAVVLLLAHPSKAGQVDGSGLSGSTAWDGAVRSRLYLTRPDKNDEGHQDRKKRILKLMKSNYADLSDDQELWWHHGRFVNTQPMEVRYELDAQQARDEAAFLKVFDEQIKCGQTLSPKHRASNYAARSVANFAQANGMDLDEVRAIQALSRLLRDGTLRAETYGRPSQPLQRLIRATQQ